MLSNTTAEKSDFIDRYPKEVEEKAKRILALSSSSKFKAPPRWGGVFPLLFPIMWKVWKLEKHAEGIRTGLREVEVVDHDQRNSLRGVASQLAEVSKMLATAHSVLAERKEFEAWLFSPRLLRRLEDLSCAFEDMSETSALGASEAFAVAVRERLEAALKHARD